MKDKLTVTLIQTALAWEDKAANLNKLQQKIEGLQEKTHIIILPEMFSTGFSMNAPVLAETMDGPTVAWMKTMAAQKKVVLTGSLIIKEDFGANKHSYYNRLIWMLPTGQYGYYDKRHLFAFAGEDESYTAGEKRLIASVNNWKLNLQVCYDLRFPVWARQVIASQTPRQEIAPEYDVLVYVANWPETRVHAWRTLLQARAIENQCYVIGVNRVGTDGKGIHYSGNSMVVDPLGAILYDKKDEEDIFTITLDKEHLNTVRQKFPFWKDADQFKIY
ncbi:nitrilase family protein [Niabella digestorum]|jgi:Predicted amidohydrolase|uniref:Nitrilase family protein n=1 Tax=Niabella digestorum TaxID=3117701 RepID=A0ABU7RHG5_9BACT